MAPANPPFPSKKRTLSSNAHTSVSTKSDKPSWGSSRKWERSTNPSVRRMRNWSRWTSTWYIATWTETSMERTSLLFADLHNLWCSHSFRISSNIIL
jgi:hypothetical protein